MTKQPTPQGISALLKNAGFTRSRWQRGQIVGSHEHTEGYRVRRHGEGSVVVEHLLPWSRMRDQVQVRQMLYRYSSTIIAAGYEVTVSDTGAIGHLIVDAKET